MSLMDEGERNEQAEAVCRALGRDVEARGGQAGASTAMSTVIKGSDGRLYTVAATLLVSVWDMSARDDETRRDG